MDFFEGAYSFNLVTTSHNDEQGFLLSSAIFEEPNRVNYKTDYLSPWVNVDDSASWLMRVKLNTKGEFVQQDPAKNSIFMWYEWPESILEYSPCKMIVALRPSRFLILKDWLPVRHID